MNDQILLVVLAIGTGVSIGWMLRTVHLRLNPEGMAKIAESLSMQMQEVKLEAKAEIARADSRWQEALDTANANARDWQGHANNLQGTLSAMAPSLPPSERPRALSPEQAGARVNGNGMSAETKVRDALIAKGISPEIATKVARGETDDLPPDALMDALAMGIRQDETGVT